MDRPYENKDKEDPESLSKILPLSSKLPALVVDLEVLDVKRIVLTSMKSWCSFCNSRRHCLTN